MNKDSRNHRLAIRILEDLLEKKTRTYESQCTFIGQHIFSINSVSDKIARESIPIRDKALDECRDVDRVLEYLRRTAPEPSKAGRRKK